MLPAALGWNRSLLFVIEMGISKFYRRLKWDEKDFATVTETKSSSLIRSRPVFLTASNIAVIVRAAQK